MGDPRTRSLREHMGRRGALLVLLLWTALARAEPVRRIPVVLHLAEVAGAAVASEDFVHEQLTRANQVFTPLGIELVLQRRRPLAALHAELSTRADRDALARYVRPGAIHWFVVSKLMDVDEPGRERRGVHWRAQRSARRHFVVTSKISGPYVLAHELGHYFGNPLHSQLAGNLMSYQPGQGAPFLDHAQIANVRATLAHLLKTRALIALPAPKD